MKRRFEKGRVFMGRFPHGGDLLAEVEKLAGELKIKTAFIRIIGAVSRGAFSFYDQEKRQYRDVIVDGKMEIVSCQGNLSLLKGKEKAHIHVIFSDSQGRCLGGHLVEGTTIFAAEYYLEELLGDPLEREYDETTGLNLWRM